MVVSKDESKAASAGYVLSFFSELEALSMNLAAYITALAKMKKKYPEGTINADTQLEPGDEWIVQTIDSVKMSVIRTYVKFQALQEKVKEFKAKAKEIRATYDRIKEEPVPTVDDIESFTLELNRLFVEGVVSELLTTARAVYAQMVSS